MLLSFPAEPAASLQGAEISQSSERCKYLLSGHLCHPCSHPPQWPLPSWKFHKGPSMRLEKRGESWGHRVLCPFCELSLLTFLPSKSSDVNNSGRFSITLILSSKWLALKILEIKQQKYYFCPEKKKKSQHCFFCLQLSGQLVPEHHFICFVEILPSRASYTPGMRSLTKCNRKRNFSPRHINRT